MGYLERDSRESSAQVQQLTRALCQAEKDKIQAQMDYSENTLRLKEKLKTVSPPPRHPPHTLHVRIIDLCLYERPSR